MSEKEIRGMVLDSLEVRTPDDSEKCIIEGYINKYNTRSQYMGFFEELSIGCFDTSLVERDYIPALYNHNTDKILGSTRSGSLKLSSDDIGLKFSLEINPKVSYANDLYQLVRSGDVGGCSFGFRVKDDEWDKLEDGTSLRIIKDVDLLEVTITPFPAYLDSDASCRSFELYQKEEESQRATVKEIRKLEIELMKLELS